MINTIILGNAITELPKLPSELVNCCVCSPPYWGLRDYGIEPAIWDGDKDCEHEWGLPIAGAGKNNDKTAGKLQRGSIGSIGRDDRPDSSFCLKCNAWRGSLGLEPTFDLYIKHLCDIFDEVKRVLRKDGTCWVNLGDSYAGGKGQSGARDASFQDERFKKGESLEHGYHQASGGYGKTRPADGKIGIPAKSLCLIPQRFSIEMVNRDWILRNTIIWWKPNCMPSSANDRFTIDFEYLFFFTKNNKAIFWTNEKTLECVSKKPLGIKGIEGEDWEWRETQDWKEEEDAGYKIGATDPHRAASIGGLKLGAKHKKSGKLKKVSLWTGHDYWFEQQFEELNYDSFRETKRGKNQPKAKIGDLMSASVNARESLDAWKINPNGRNKRCVWFISTRAFPEAHFAVYPEGLIEIPIKAGCPEFVCKKCGKARVKIYQETKTEPIEIYKGQAKKDYSQAKAQNPSDTKRRILESMRTKKEEIGYTNCGCNADFEGGIVLDPFMGAGTTALVALKQRKRFIGIEIKQEYIDMANKRIAKVQQEIF